jgi:hypothetical protein
MLTVITNDDSLVMFGGDLTTGIYLIGAGLGKPRESSMGCKLSVNRTGLTPVQPVLPVKRSMGCMVAW